jgi:hypothetical protein
MVTTIFISFPNNNFGLKVSGVLFTLQYWVLPLRYACCTCLVLNFTWGSLIQSHPHASLNKDPFSNSLYLGIIMTSFSIWPVGYIGWCWLVPIAEDELVFIWVKYYLVTLSVTSVIKAYLIGLILPLYQSCRFCVRHRTLSYISIAQYWPGTEY